MADAEWLRIETAQRGPAPRLRVALLEPPQRERALAHALRGLSRWYVARAQQQRNWNPDLSIDWRRVHRDHAEAIRRAIAARAALTTCAMAEVLPRLSRLHSALDAHGLLACWAADEARHAGCWTNALQLLGEHGGPLAQPRAAPAAFTRLLPWEDPLACIAFHLFAKRAAWLADRRLLRTLHDAARPVPDADTALAAAIRLVSVDDAVLTYGASEVARFLLYYDPERMLTVLAQVAQALLRTAPARDRGALRCPRADDLSTLFMLDATTLVESVVSPVFGVLAVSLSLLTHGSRPPHASVSTTISEHVEWGALEWRVARSAARHAQHAMDAGVPLSADAQWRAAWALRPGTA
ncbi:MAG: hypothetical protein MUF00_07220 [Gemmatimonadaceae bacterium]|nr:hypothetical protein [Gemmatimonadaceae bacterium]